MESMKLKDREQKIADDLKMNELLPQHQNYEKAAKNFQRIKMLNGARRITSLNLLGQRRIQLSEKRHFYQDLLSSKVNVLKQEARGLRKI